MNKKEGMSELEKALDCIFKMKESPDSLDYARKFIKHSSVLTYKRFVHDALDYYEAKYAEKHKNGK